MFSDVEGEVLINGNLKQFVNGNNMKTGGDGFIGHILIDGVEVWSSYVDGYDTIGIDYSVNVSINIGSIIDIALSPGASNNDTYDHAYFTTQITIPEPATLSLLTLGALAMLRRRKV